MTAMRLGQGLGQRPRLLLTILAMLTMLTLLGSLSACAAGTAIQSSPPGIMTPATTPTPSWPTIALNAVTLGGSVAAFDKKFGASNCCYQNGWLYHGPYGPMWTGVNTTHTPASNVDESSTQRVIDVENGGWLGGGLNLTMTQAKSLCGSFLPADAALRRTYTVSSNGIVDGIELQYISTLLANTLPASDFFAGERIPAPPGIIFVYYATSGATVDSCGLTTVERLLNLPG